MKPWEIPPKEAADIEATLGFSFLAWETFGRWLDWYRATNPNDDRSDYDLVGVYSEQIEKES